MQVLDYIKIEQTNGPWNGISDKDVLTAECAQGTLKNLFDRL